MFEVSRANLRLFELEPVVSFAEALIDGPCHVIHNNSFRTYPGGGITGGPGANAAREALADWKRRHGGHHRGG